MKIILLIAGFVLFFVSVITHIYVRIKYRPKDDEDFDEIYWEFEDSYPGFASFDRLLRITFAAAVIGAILIFLALVF